MCFAVKPIILGFSFARPWTYSSETQMPQCIVFGGAGVSLRVIKLRGNPLVSRSPLFSTSDPLSYPIVHQMNFNALPTVSFTPTSVSFPFEPKQLSLSNKVRVQLEPQSSVVPSPSNGIFSRGSLSLSAPHAEVWIQGKQV